MVDQGIYVIIDGSGSMHGVKHDVVKGINEFIKEQQDDVKGTNDVVQFSLIAFDTNVSEVYLKEDIALVKSIGVNDVFLGGGTALYDAIGRTLTKAEDEAADRNIVVIYTDGEERDSTEFTRDDVDKLLTSLGDTGKWQVIYLGAEFGDFEESASYSAFASSGITGATNTSKGMVTNTFKNVSATTNYHRMSDSATYASINTRGGLVSASAEDAGIDWDSVKEDDDTTPSTP